MVVLGFKFDQLPSGLPRESAKAREKAFLEHYRSLTECALQFTRGQRERAEDLVHDVFVQFQVKQVDLEAIEDVRSYLKGILRNLYLLQLRRTTRHPVQQFSLLDHDSADMGLRAQSPLDQLHSVDLLVRACQFVRHRKETSVPASILILRFFHGYYTDEICRITGAGRRQVNKWLTRGRTEAKNFLAQPLSLAEREPVFPAFKTSSQCAFLRYLRKLIFDSCATPCAILDEGEETNGTRMLAHLVSCQACLERRSRGLGLPIIAERMMDDISSGNDDAAKGSKDTGHKRPLLRSNRPARLAKRIDSIYRNRMRQIFEHHPSELSIAFDGETHATLLLNAPLNTLNLSLERKQCPDSIGILSEQEVCLLILDRREIECEGSKVYLIPFSDGRSLEVILTPEFRGPSIHIAYRDPGQAAARIEWASDADEEPLLPVETVTGVPRVAPLPGWRSSILRDFRGFERLRMNPILATALALAVVASVLLVAGLRQDWLKERVADLLRNAAGADSSISVAVEPGVIRQKVRIRTAGYTIDRDLYRDAQRKRRARPRDRNVDETLNRRLADAGVNWDLPLSAASYKDWHDRQRNRQDTMTHQGNNLIVLTTTLVGDALVSKEALTLRESDLHTVGRSIEFQDSGTVEIAELSYTELPWGPEMDGLFEPLAAQSSALPRAVQPSLASRLPRFLSGAEFDEAELEARLVLQQLGADTNERIGIARGRNCVNVRGVVATGERKREIEAHLRQVPNVNSAIYTFDELENGAVSPGAGVTSLKQSSVIEAQSPLESYLMTTGASREDIRQTGLELSNASVVVSRECKAITELLSRYSAQESLSANARNALETLISDDKTKLLTAIDKEERLLKDFSFSPASGPDGRSDALTETIERVNALCVELLSGATEPSRPARVIVPELERAIAQLRSAAIQIPDSFPHPQSSLTHTSEVPNRP